jgi:hypothetical protein
LNEEAGKDREGDNKKAAGEVTFIEGSYVFKW